MTGLTGYGGVDLGMVWEDPGIILGGFGFGLGQVKGGFGLVIGPCFDLGLIKTGPGQYLGLRIYGL